MYEIPQIPTTKFQVIVFNACPTSNSLRCLDTGHLSSSHVIQDLNNAENIEQLVYNYYFYRKISFYEKCNFHYRSNTDDFWMVWRQYKKY